MKSLIYPVLAQTFQQRQGRYTRNTIHCTKSNCFQEILNSPDLYLPVVGYTLTPVYLLCYTSPITLLLSYQMIMTPNAPTCSLILIPKFLHLFQWYSTTIFQLYIFQNFQPQFSSFIIWSQPNPCLIFQVYYARCTPTSISVHQYKFPVSTSINIFKTQSP